VDAGIEFSEFAVLIGAMSLYLAALPPPYPSTKLTASYSITLLTFLSVFRQDWNVIQDVSLHSQHWGTLLLVLYL